MTSAVDMWFGLRPPTDVVAKVIWGARAIFETSYKYGATIDVVHNRQQMNFDETTREERVVLSDWIHNKGLPALRKWVDKNGIDTGSRQVFTFTDGFFTMEASPRGSYGYMYIGAWQSVPQPPPDTENCKYNNFIPTPEQLEANGGPLPEVGTRVKVLGSYDGKPFGKGTVEGYFREYEFVGVIVKLDKAPPAHTKNNKGTWHEGRSLVFRREFDVIIV